MTVLSFVRAPVLRAFVSIVLLMLISIVPSGCSGAKNITVTNLPQGVSQAEVVNWFVATGALRDVGKWTRTVTESATTLRREGVIAADNQGYQQFLEIIGRAATAGVYATNVLDQTPQFFGTSQATQVWSYIDTIWVELQKANTTGLTGLGPQASTVLNNAVSKLISAGRIVYELTKALKGATVTSNMKLPYDWPSAADVRRLSYV